MSLSLNAQEFVQKWKRSELRERASSQEHFIDICRLVGHPTPAEIDPKGTSFTFDYGSTKLTGGKGWADVWKKDHFGWEYKGKHGDLDAAYDQLLQYREALRNPPLLIVSDMSRILVHTNFTNSVKRTFIIELEDLLAPQGTELLWHCFHDVEALRPGQTTSQVTEQAAAEFGEIARTLEGYSEDAHSVAHFLIRILFCLFAEDIGLIPSGVITRLLERQLKVSRDFVKPLGQLFKAMATGDWFGEHQIRLIDGGLFDDDFVLELPSDAIETLRRVAVLDWSAIEPSIFGTLFERSLDPSKRAQLGAHYTSREDMELLIEPVLMAPLRRGWSETKAVVERLIGSPLEGYVGEPKPSVQEQALNSLLSFGKDLEGVSVLDPACGSGNFLYVALTSLLDLQKEVISAARVLGGSGLRPTVSPTQLHGIEVSPYAHELAEATIWIGYIQWMHQNGYGFPSEPILKPLDSILNIDAILATDENGAPLEPDWPEADVVVGNPPYLGDKKMRAELGADYVEQLRGLYEERIPGGSDLVCYWFEKAREQIETGKAKRVGLLATQGIRGRANRVVLDRIKETGDIFWAESDRPWILDGAMVHVSMIGFDDGSEGERVLDGEKVVEINSDLTSGVDTTQAESLKENEGIAFVGSQKGGPFNIPGRLAKRMLDDKGNPNGRPNSDVVRPWTNALDITSRPRGKWIIDFGSDMSEGEASQYVLPFEYVREHVRPGRERVRSEEGTTARWWLHQRPRPEMRSAISQLRRYIATPRHSKHRVFTWVNPRTLSDSAVVVFARDDDYFMGILQSRVHEVWARHTGTQVREAESGFRYSQTLTFETFPLPWPPGREPTSTREYEAVAEASKRLTRMRDEWLAGGAGDGGDAHRRSITQLYNDQPRWLELAHQQLDEAVLAAYGLGAGATPPEVLERLLELNQLRAHADSQNSLHVD